MIWIKRALLILLAAAIGIGCGLCLDPILYERENHRIDVNIGLASLREGTQTVESVSSSVGGMKVAIAAMLIGAAMALLLFFLFYHGKLLRALPALAVCLFLAAAAVMASWAMNPRNVDYQQEGTAENIDLALANCVNCELTNGVYTITGGDPQLFFPILRDRTASAVIRFREPAGADGQAQVFFVGDTTGLSEYNSITHVLLKGAKEICFNFVPGNYDTLRFDLDVTDLQIESISVSDQHATVHRVTSPEFRLVPLLAAALFLMWGLFFLTPAVRRAADMAYRNLLDPDSRYLWIDIAYTVFAGAMLLHHIYGAFQYNGIENCIVYLRYPALIFAGVSVLLGRMWKDKGFWLFAAFWLLKLVRLYTIDPVLSADADRQLLTGVYAFFGCYAVGRALKPSFRKPFLQILCAVGTLAAVCLCGLGIYSAWTGVVFRSPGGARIQVLGGRMYLLYYCVTSGVIVTSCMSLGLVGFAATKQKWARVLYTLSALVILVATALCGSRTGQLLAASAFALMACIQLYDRFAPRKDSRGVWHLSLAKWMVILGLFAVMTVGLTFAQPYIVDGFVGLRTRGGLVVSRAMAEAISSGPWIAHRGFAANTIDGVSSGRIVIWQDALRVITADTDTFLWGESIVQPMQYVNAPRGFYVEHCHSLYLQTFLESGLAGVLVLLSILVYFGYHAIRLMKDRDLPLWQRVAPIPAIAILISELVEVITYLYYDYAALSILYVSMGWTIALSRAKKQEGPQSAESRA